MQHVKRMPRPAFTIVFQSETQEELIAQLQWLESAACHSQITGSERIRRRRDVTMRFRQVLETNELLRQMANQKN
jgi:hypothetical protein